ncbi:MAG: helix-turn-helix domain-containing protein [Pseudomonadota bacterium]
MTSLVPLSLRRDASNECYELKYFDPPKELERHILALFELRHFDGPYQDRHPGALAQLFLIIRGYASGQFGDRVDTVEGRPALFNAFEAAVPYTADGPLWCVGASLSPFGWAALTQASVKEYGHRFMRASEVLGEDIDLLASDLVPRRLSGETSTEQACSEVAEWIGARLQPIPSSHERVIEKVLAWLGSSLNPPVEGLVDDPEYSRRQMERIVQRHFGFAPRGLARKFRAIRAANLLLQPDLTDEGEAEIADAFVDQSHMIREIRHFCGFTPSRLGGSGGLMFQQLTQMQNLDRLRPYRAIGSPDSKA